jgi:hypothetical protein
MSLHQAVAKKIEEWKQQDDTRGGACGNTDLCCHGVCIDELAALLAAHPAEPSEPLPTRFTEQGAPQDVSLSDQSCDECGGTFVFMECLDGDCSHQDPNYCPLCGRYSIPARMAGKITLAAAHPASQPEGSSTRQGRPARANAGKHLTHREPPAEPQAGTEREK